MSRPPAWVWHILTAPAALVGWLVSARPCSRTNWDAGEQARGRR